MSRTVVVVLAVCMTLAALAGGASAADSPAPVLPKAPAQSAGTVQVRAIPEPPARELGTTQARFSAGYEGSAPLTEALAIRSVIGTDGRIQVTPATSYPARAIGQVVFNQDGGGYSCTGWLIDSNTILTSGHCAFTPPDNVIESATFTPGRDGASDPYGTCGVTAVYAPDKWRYDGKEAHDWAVMQLNCTVGDTVGWLGYFWKKGATALVKTKAQVEGYPGDKPSGTHWYMLGKVSKSDKKMVYYKMDTFGGQSGSPVFHPNKRNCGPCGMAIHSYGVHGSDWHMKFNHAPRITKGRFNLIDQLKHQNDPAPPP